MSQARLELLCRGVVQGVGFRPLVHRLASELALVGELDNVPGAVRLRLQGERRQLEQLVRRLPEALQPPGVLEPLEPHWLPPVAPVPVGLRIAAAPGRPLGEGLFATALAPDLAPCAACLAELRNPADRRYRYPLISCARCGPRYSIATAEPYARAHTTMAAFALCPDCQSEFDDPCSRRFHAETIACPRCGPTLLWRDGQGGGEQSGEAALQAAVALLQRGEVLALQGVGGFQLLVDASNPAAIARLRQRKGRPRKPFALLLADVSWAEPWAELTASERALLQGPAAPIVLLRCRRGAPALPPGLAPGCGELGMMLPASPLHLLLAEAFGAPLVCTSANRSGEPLCCTAEDAMARLGPAAVGGAVADGWLMHNRPIARGLDDSLLRCIAGRPQMLRRARGYAPSPIALPPWASGERWLLALGGDLKAAPALAGGPWLWLAPQLGDLAHAGLHSLWQRGVQQVLDEHGSRLAALVSDQHPGYLSHQWARQWSRSASGRHHLRVQHHRAHGLAVLAEHGAAPPVLVLACDGLGYGSGPVPLWGGEGLLVDRSGAATRLVSLRPLALPGGQLAQREPRRVALALLAAMGERALQHPGARAVHAAFDPGQRQLLLQALAAACCAPRTTSLGRLFDGAASLLDLVQQLSFEGEGGLLLEGAAERALLAAPLAAAPLPLVPAEPGAGAPCWLDWQPLMQSLLDWRAAGVEVPACALGFHRALITGWAAWAREAAASSGTATVVLAGGCFQNRVLLEGLITALEDSGLKPLWAEQLPTSDGALALGQVAAARLMGA